MLVRPRYEDHGGPKCKTVSARYDGLRETAGREWLEAPLVRIGASSLLNDLLTQRRKQLTGA